MNTVKWDFILRVLLIYVIKWRLPWLAARDSFRLSVMMWLARLEWNGNIACIMLRYIRTGHLFNVYHSTPFKDQFCFISILCWGEKKSFWLEGGNKDFSVFAGLVLNLHISTHKLAYIQFWLEHTELDFWTCNSWKC